MTVVPARRWEIAPGRALVGGGEDGPLLMAIVNATPDSFSDGGRFLDPAHALEACLRAVDEGAAIVDLGGESTRPGAAPVPAAEQIRRVIPVIRAFRAARTTPVSIDTTSAEVARAALDEGADIVNDTSAGCDDPRLLPLVAERRAGVVLMHRERPPVAERWSHEHPGAGEGADDGVPVVRRVVEALGERVRAAREAGIEPGAIAIDPGLGFGKSVAENFELLSGLAEIAALGPPVLVGASRKSFIGAAGGVARPQDRLAGSLAAAVIAAQRGASILRVHEVEPHRQALAVARRIGVPSTAGSTGPRAHSTGVPTLLP